MNKNKALHIIIISIAVLSLTLSIYSVATAKTARGLYNFAVSAKVLNIHIGEFSISDKAKDISTQELIKTLRQRLEKRKTINFNIVKDIEDADLSISGEIIKFMYREHDPIDIFIPLGLVIDLLTAKNYARLEYEMKVLDLKKNKVIWQRRLKATITEPDLPREESISLIIDRAAYVFIKEYFRQVEG